MKLFALWFNTIETDLQDMFILKQFPNRDSIGIAMLFHNFPLYLFKIKLWSRLHNIKLNGISVLRKSETRESIQLCVSRAI